MNTQKRLDASMELLERSNKEFNPGGNTMIAAELLWGAYAQLSLAVAELRGWPASSHGAYRNTVTNLRHPISGLVQTSPLAYPPTNPHHSRLSR